VPAEPLPIEPPLSPQAEADRAWLRERLGERKETCLAETTPGMGPESAGAAPEHRQAGSGSNPEDNHV
jgi:hypothetical protein